MSIKTNMAMPDATVSNVGALSRSENVKYSTIIQGPIKSSELDRLSRFMFISFGHIGEYIVGIRLADLFSACPQYRNPLPVCKYEIIDIHGCNVIQIHHAVAVTA